MPQPLDAASDFPFRPVAIQRSKWTHHFHVWSPKLARRLALYSWQAIDFWAMIESHASILTFCELPGFILVDQRPHIADFVLRKSEGDEFVVLDGLPLSTLDTHERDILDPLPVTSVSTDALKPHRQWIDNWLRILPYVTSNFRFVTPRLIDFVEENLSSAKPLFTIERDALPADPVLTRTAVFELARLGRLISADLNATPLSLHTRFVRTGQIEGVHRG
jgi:hypothetical protein